MKPVHNYAGHKTFDLTACNVHKISEPDGSARVVAYCPKTWVAGEKQALLTVNGAFGEYVQYEVTEWDEVTLATIPAPIQEKRE